MGCDIHAFIEIKEEGKWVPAGEIDLDRNYGLFGFLADVRNYSHVPVLSQPRGIPKDSSLQEKVEGGDYHSHSYFTLQELVSVDYYQTFWDRRVTKQIAPNMWSGASLAEEGEGVTTSLWHFLPKAYFDLILALGKKYENELENVRLVFWFDN